jgi:tetratricopeptide (TPR) repeat protein
MLENKEEAMHKGLSPVLLSIVTAALVLVFGCGDSNVNKAKAFQAQKKYDQAIQHYRLALDKDPENKTARYGLIETYAQKVINKGGEQLAPEYVEEVMADLEPVAQPLMSDQNIKRYISLVYQMLAKRYAEAGRNDKAAEAWAKVIEIEPSFAEAHFNLGMAMCLGGKYEKAIPHFEKAISLNPYFVKGYQALGDTLLRLKRNEEAAQQYLKALELNPDDPAIHHNLGLTYFNEGNVEKAIDEYQKALEIEPDYAFAYRSLHDAYERAGNTEKVKEIDEKWKKMTEDYLQALRESNSASPEPSETPGGS